jgi:hypothetical protein
MRIRLAGHVVRMGEKKNAYRVLMVKAERKRQLGRSKSRSENSIKINLRKPA